MNRQIKPGYKTLSVMMSFFIGSAVITLLPLGTVYKNSLLGYRAICPFAPFSTLACLMFGALTFFVRRTFFIDASNRSAS